MPVRGARGGEHKQKKQCCGARIRVPQWGTLEWTGQDRYSEADGNNAHVYIHTFGMYLWHCLEELWMGQLLFTLGGSGGPFFACCTVFILRPKYWVREKDFAYSWCGTLFYELVTRRSVESTVAPYANGPGAGDPHQSGEQAANSAMWPSFNGCVADPQNHHVPAANNIKAVTARVAPCIFFQQYYMQYIS